MSEREDQFRRLAAESLLLAHETKDPSRRLVLVGMAQRWVELADGGQQDLNALLTEYNEQKMVHSPALDRQLEQQQQQQQQIQPKR